MFFKVQYSKSNNLKNRSLKAHSGCRRLIAASSLQNIENTDSLLRAHKNCDHILLQFFLRALDSMGHTKMPKREQDCKFYHSFAKCVPLRPTSGSYLEALKFCKNAE